MSLITSSETESLIRAWTSRAVAQGYKPNPKTYAKLELEFFLGAMTTLRALGRSYPPVWELILMSGRSLSATVRPMPSAQPAVRGKE
jgi:hypothetical protein